MASACLPLMFEAVEVDGEFYWDGGYLGNPAIHPLIHECDSSDVVIVQINPMNRPDVPLSARDILNRINEMTFNASLVREMEGFATITRMIENGELQNDRYTAVRFHEISAEAELADMGSLSKMNTERGFPRASPSARAMKPPINGSPRISSASAGKAPSISTRGLGKGARARFARASHPPLSPRGERVGVRGR